MPLQRRLPKRGFKNPFMKTFAEIRITHLNRFEEGSVVDEAMLQSAGLAHGRHDGVKIIGNDELNVRVDVKVHRISRAPVSKAKGARWS